MLSNTSLYSSNTPRIPWTSSSNLPNLCTIVLASPAAGGGLGAYTGAGTAGASSVTFGAPAIATCCLSGPGATQAQVSSSSLQIYSLTNSTISIIGRS
ncbi:hypothetical protein Tco_0000681 [Tanacetum coccineum]